MEKKIIVLMALSISLLSYADNEDYGHKDISGLDFSNMSLKEALFVSSTAVGTNFQHSDLTRAVFWNATLTNADFTDAVINGTDFVRGSDFSNTVSQGFTKEQLYSTASYKNKDLSRIILSYNDLTGWNFSGQNLTNASFNGATLTNADLSQANLTKAIFYEATLTNTDFTDAVINGADFSNTVSRGFTKEQLYSTASYKNKELSVIRLRNNNLVGWDFSEQNLILVDFTNADLSQANLTSASLNADLTDADFTDAVVVGANFSGTTSQGFTKEQLYSTVSYNKHKNLISVCLDRNDLKGWDFSNQNLMNAQFNSATLTNVDLSQSTLASTDFTNADLRGANLDNIVGALITKNTIWNDGVIKNFKMESENDSFTVRRYTSAKSRDIISAKIDTDASISNGAALTIENGECLHITNNATLTLADGGVLVFEASDGSNSSVLIESGSGFSFGETSKIIVNLSEDFSTPQTFAVMNWTDFSKISGTENLVKDQNIFVNFADGQSDIFWSFSITESGLYLNIPEPSTYAAVIGAIALAVAVYRRRK